MTEHQLFVPAPTDHRGKPRWLNANDTMHWAPKSKLIRAWLMRTIAAAQTARLPKDLRQVEIIGYVNKDNNASYDAHNLYPTLKAMIDGLTDPRSRQPGYGMIPDDNNDILIDARMKAGEKRSPAGITLIIKETA